MRKFLDLAIGLDIGHSRIKCAASRPPHKAVTQIDFPTLVVPWFELSDEGTARNAASDAVTVGDQRYFVGRTAERQSPAQTFVGQSADWTMTLEHDALFVGALQHLEAALGGRIEGGDLVVGLPAQYYHAGRAALKTRLEKLLAARGSSRLAVRVCAQPRAPLIGLSFGSDLKPSSVPVDEATFGVIEVGHFTTDFLVAVEGDLIDRGSGSCSGVRLVHEALIPLLTARKLPTDTRSLSRALETRQLLVMGKHVDVGAEVSEASRRLINEVMAETQRRFADYVSHMERIVLAGGGAPLVYEALRARYPHVALTDQPRMAVAEGFRRLAGVTAALREPADAVPA